jgi:molybdopterin molybdotransferase
MLLPQDAETLILKQVEPLNDRQIVALNQCRDRVLATPITSHLDFPHWDNSAMDGYAVRYADVQTVPVRLNIVETIPAGLAPQITIQSGQAARILTGSMLPAGADTVVMQENTQREGDQVTILESPQPQQFVRKQGVYYQAGQPLLNAGIKLTAAEIAILAAAQVTQIPVYRRPKVAILSTGSELIEPDRPLQPGQIVDSNQYALAALVEQMGAIAIPLGIAADDPVRLKAAMQAAIEQADIVLSSGGVSVGDYDYVDRLLAEIGATIHIRKVAVKPGKPLTFATLGEKLYFGLPGNPASAMVTFWRFVQPAMRKRSGLIQGWLPQWINAVNQQPLKSDGHRETYLWGQLQFTNGQPEFHIAPGSQLSGNLINLAGITGLGVLPIGVGEIPVGQSIKVMALS